MLRGRRRGGGRESRNCMNITIILDHYRASSMLSAHKTAGLFSKVKLYLILVVISNVYFLGDLHPSIVIQLLLLVWCHFFLGSQEEPLEKRNI